MQVRNPLVRIDHRQAWPVREGCINVCLDCGLLLVRQILDTCQQVAESVVRIDANFVEHDRMFREDVGKENADRMAEDDRVRHLHHRCFKMHGQQHIFSFGIGNFLSEEFPQRISIHHRRVDDFARLQSQHLFKDGHAAVLADQFDPHRVCFRHHMRLLASIEVAVTHRGNVRLRVGTPRSHRVWILLRVIFHRASDSTIRVAFTQHGIDSAAKDFCITTSDFFFLFGRWLAGKIRDVVAVCLQLCNGDRKLRDRRADIRQLDDVGVWLLDHLAEFCQSVRLLLLVRQPLGKTGKNPPGKRNIPSLDSDPRRLRKPANNW